MVLLALVAAGMIFTPQVVGLIAGGDGFTGVEGKLALTVHQTRIMFSFILFVSLYAYFMAILNALGAFWLPAFAPTLWNVSMLAFIFFGRESLGNDALAWGTLIGGVLQMAILIPLLVKKGYFPNFGKFWGSPEVRKVLKALGPSILGLSVLQLTVIINTHFASHLEEGANSWIFLADRILELPLSLFAVSLGTVALTTLSGHWSNGDRESLIHSAAHAFRLVLFVAIPSACGLLFLSRPMMETLFQHGRFSAYDTAKAASVVQIYGLGVIGAAGVRVMAPVFYAMKNTWTPAIAAIVALICHVVIAQVLMAQFGIQGLAASSVLSGFINLGVLMLAFRKNVGPFPWKELLKSVARFLVAAAVLSAVCSIQYWFESFGDEGIVIRALRLGATILLAIIAYFGMSYLLGVPEFTEVVKPRIDRLKKRFF
jgi:putative peptidoglycan lipid II flippase